MKRLLRRWEWCLKDFAWYRQMQGGKWGRYCYLGEFTQWDRPEVYRASPIRQKFQVAQFEDWDLSKREKETTNEKAEVAD